MERRLYDTDPYCGEFTAMILSCKAEKDGYRVSLEPEGFYPGGGGNPADIGSIENAPLLSADEKSCTYVVGRAFAVGETVSCQVDMAHRMDYMRQHTAEHIVSGILFAMTGGENVGFHMSDDCVTVDWSVELTAEQLLECELRANRAAMDNLPVTVAFYPGIPPFPYRAKKALTGNIRIVTVEGVDVCACCAMHVHRTGEVGQIRIIDAMRWRGGTRLTLLAGERSLRDAQTIAAQNRQISNLVSAKPYETATAVRKALDATEMVKAANTLLRSRFNDLRVQSLESISGALLLFEDEMNPDELRHLALKLSEARPDRVAVFSGTDAFGYRYAISAAEDVRPLTKEMNTTLSGRGGGTAALTQGSVKASKAMIESFFAGK